MSHSLRRRRRCPILVILAFLLFLCFSNQMVLFGSAFNLGSLFDLLEPILPIWWGWGKEPHFRESQFFNVNEIVGFNGIHGHVACIGDFNADKNQDLFVVSNDYRTLDVYIWRSDEYTFERLESARVVVATNITNVIAGDFNYDGRLDVLISRRATSQQGGGGNGADVHIVQTLDLYFGNGNQLEWYSTQSHATVDQVLALDINGDMYPDLFGVDAATGKRSFWVNNGSGNFTLTEQKPAPGHPLHPLATPVAQSFVDLDGDCLSDLAIVSCADINGQNCETNRIFELWISKNGELSLNKELHPRLGAGQPIFADFNRDGTMDIMYPVCYPQPSCSEQNGIIVLYNRQKPLCATSYINTGDCRLVTDMCASSDYSFDNNEQLAVNFLTSKMRLNSYNWGANGISHPSMIRAGDFNNDGYLDLLLVVDEEEGGTLKTRTTLWISVPCTEELCSASEVSKRYRTFKLATEGVDALSSVADPMAAFFFDFDESGKFDVIVLSDERGSTDGTSTGNLTITALYNNFYLDAFFLKTLTLNGKCASWCYSDLKYPTMKPYGVNTPGVVVKFAVSDLDNVQYMSTGGQLTQSSYLSLQTPYLLFGLGRPTSYIDMLFVGLPINRAGTEAIASWPALMPNSQLVVVPYPLDSPSSWSLEMYVNPSHQTIFVFLAVVLSMILLAVPILCLTRREKLEDRREKQQMQHLFDAL